MKEPVPLGRTTPQRCLLAQAAHWYVHGTMPISDRAYAAAPIPVGNEMDKLRKLFIFLFENNCELKGLLTARHAFIVGAPYEESQLTYEYDSFGYRYFDVYMNDFRFEDVSFEKSELLFKSYFKYNFADEYLKELNERWNTGDIELVFQNVTLNFAKLMGVALLSEENNELQLPPYLSFMIKAAKSLGLDASKRVPIKNIEGWLLDNWPTETLGPSSANKLRYMATLLRRPEDEKGGHHGANNRSS